MSRSVFFRCLFVALAWSSLHGGYVDAQPKAEAPSPTLKATFANHMVMLYGEDKEVAAYFVERGWLLGLNFLGSEPEPMIVLRPWNRDPGDTVVTGEDYSMILRSKAIQAVSLRDFKVTDEGLKTLAGRPQIRGIMLGGEQFSDEGLKALATCKSLTLLEIVDNNKVTDAGIRALAACKSLTDVNLSTPKVSDAGVKALADLPNLRTLCLRDLSIDGSGFAAFVGSKILRNVDLYNLQQFTDDSARYLAALPNLTRLHISGNQARLTAAGIKAIMNVRLPVDFEFPMQLMDDAMFETLVARGWLYGPVPADYKKWRPASADEVDEIRLWHSSVTDKGFAAVLDCVNVKELYLSRTRITDETLKKISAFKKLKALWLTETKVTAAGLNAVAGLPIQSIGLGKCELSEDCFKAIGKMAALKRLSLSGAKMKVAWLKNLSRLANLTNLDLGDTEFDNSAVEHVTSLLSLQNVSLARTELGDDGFRRLVRMPNMEYLYVGKTKVTREAYLQSRKDFPRIHIAGD